MSIDIVTTNVPLKESPRADPPAGDVVSCETALACLFRLGAQNGVYAEIGAVQRRNLIDGDTVPVARLIELTGEFGLRAERAHFDWDSLRATPFSHPILLLLANNNVVVLMGMRRDGPEEAAVCDPLFRDGEPFFVPREKLEAVWQGDALVITPLPPSKADTAFGFSWFTSKLFAERILMRDIVVAALSMHLIALSVPIFFQLLVDKVIPNQALSTLYALSAGMGVLILFDAGFNYLRNYLLAFITRKLDHQVATSTIEHLLRLPIDYFHANPSGVVAYKLQEANNVRDFLASRLFNTVLDFLALFIYLPVLLIYSWRLTLIVLGAAVAAFVILAAMSRTFRRQLNEVNEIEGRRKAFLFEILNGMATIKTLALEPRSMLRWRLYTNEAASKNLSVNQTAAGARSVVTSLERGMSVGIGALGALFVLSDQMTVGALVAFNMMGLRMVQPLSGLGIDARLPAGRIVTEIAGSTDADCSRAVERPARPGGPRPYRIRRCHISLPELADAGNQGHVLRDRARTDHRYCRPQRLWQDDDHPADPGALSAAGRIGQYRRPGPEGARSRSSAHPDWRRPAGELFVPWHGAREHRNDQAHRVIGRGGACRPARRCARIHPATTTRLLDDARGERGQPVGWPAPAPGDRTCADPRPAGAGAGRGHELARPRERSHHPAAPRRNGARPDDRHHHAPTLFRGARRCDHRRRPRPCGAGRQARSPARQLPAL
jgi:hypothetical protein